MPRKQKREKYRRNGGRLGLKKSGNIWDNGTILDPKTGKSYSCKMEFDGNDKLKVRGYMGLSLLGRTQTWYKVK